MLYRADRRLSIIWPPSMEALHNSTTNAVLRQEILTPGAAAAARARVSKVTKSVTMIPVPDSLPRPQLEAFNFQQLYMHRRHSRTIVHNSLVVSISKL
jgi:hypothetical protein